MWDSKGGVTVKLPDGSTENFESVSGSDVKKLAREAGVKRFHVKGEDGEAIQEGSFPVTSGTIAIEEYNEAKVIETLWTV